MEIYVKAQIKNGLLYRAVQKCGSQRALAEYLGVHEITIGQWLNFQRVPAIDSLPDLYDPIDIKLIQLIGYGLEEIFPLEVRTNALALRSASRMEAVLDLPIENLIAAGAAPKLLDNPERNIEASEMRGVLEDVLDTLTPREAKVIRMRFGLSPYSNAHTLEDVSSEFAVTRERIRQIEAKALRDLRHPVRAKQLKPVRTFFGQ